FWSTNIRLQKAKSTLYSKMDDYRLADGVNSRMKRTGSGIITESEDISQHYQC
ncbi:hypothetical protein NPIL_535601, partial [Nephila pilipes]